MDYIIKDQVVEEIKYINMLERRTIIVHEEIDVDSCLKISYALDRIKKLDEEDGITNPEPITIMINSGGGEVYSSMHVISRIEKMQEEGYQIQCVIEGICASAALDIALVCKPRKCYRYSTLMYHQGGMGSRGTINNVEVDFLEGKRLWDLGCEIALKHTKVSRQWLDNVYNTNSDTFMSPKVALELGFIDEIL